jgi:hypothetical protein
MNKQLKLEYASHVIVDLTTGKKIKDLLGWTDEVEGRFKIVKYDNKLYMECLDFEKVCADELNQFNKIVGLGSIIERIKKNE